MNLYAKDPHNTTHVCFDREDARKYYHPPELADMACFFGEPAKKEYSPAYINRVLREARAEGFLVSYNHPDWGAGVGGGLSLLRWLFCRGGLQPFLLYGRGT